MNILRQYWGVWIMPSGNHSIFVMNETSNLNMNLKGFIEDKLGIAEYKGHKMKDQIFFDKEYVETKAGSDKIISYQGTISDKVSGMYEGIFQIGSEAGNFNLVTIGKESKVVNGLRRKLLDAHYRAFPNTKFKDDPLAAKVFHKEFPFG